MDQSVSRPDAGDRFVAIDALRGFALFGIIVVHIVEQFLNDLPPPSRPDFGVVWPRAVRPRGQSSWSRGRP